MKEADKEVKTMTMPVFCPIGLDTEAEKLMSAISGYIYSEWTNKLSMPEFTSSFMAIGILSAVQTYALEGIDAACNALQERAKTSREFKAKFPKAKKPKKRA